MGTTPPSVEFTLRPATASDAAAIRRIIAIAHINPTSLSWQRFVLATNQEGQIVGCGQVKPHRDGSQELASIAVQPEWRGKGIARAIIERLLQTHPGTLYLTCRSPLGPLYQNFGFRIISAGEMPPYFQRLSQVVRLVNKWLHQPETLLVMKRN